MTTPPLAAASPALLTCSFGVFSEARALPSLLASSCDTRHTHNHRHTMRASTSVPVCMDLGEQLTACSRRQRQHTIASLDGLPLLHWMVCKQPERGSAAPCEQGARHQKGAQTLLPLLTRGANGRQRNARMPEATHVTLFLPAAHVTVFCRQHNLNRTPATHLTPATFLMLGNVYNAGSVANTGNVANAGVRRRCYRGSVPNAAAFQGSMLVPALPFAVCAFSCLLACYGQEHPMRQMMRHVPVVWIRAPPHCPCPSPFLHPVPNFGLEHPHSVLSVLDSCSSPSLFPTPSRDTPSPFHNSSRGSALGSSPGSSLGSSPDSTRGLCPADVGAEATRIAPARP